MIRVNLLNPIPLSVLPVTCYRTVNLPSLFQHRRAQAAGWRLMAVQPSGSVRPQAEDNAA